MGVTLIIGDGTSSDNFSSIDWSTGQYFLKVEVDPLGGSNYLIEDTSQLLSVPYALYSGNSLKLTGNDYITLNNQELTIGQVDLVDDVDGILPVINGGTGSNTALMVGVITANDPASARAVLGLGTVATTASGDYATAAQGALADSALQDATVFATAAQGALADSALQASNNLSDITNVVAARTALGIDVSGTDNSTNVSLAGSLDYLTLIGQVITMGQVDYNSDISNTPTLLQLGTTSATALAGNTTTISSAQSSAITANTAKNTNVTTDLSISGTTGARTIASSDGTDAIIPIATTSVSGLLSPGLFDEIDANTAKTGITSGQSSAITANTAKNTNVTTNLSISGTTGARTIESSDGTDAIIPIATTDVSGLLSPSLFDEIDANTAKTGITSGQSSAITANTAKNTNVTTNLSISGTTGARTIESSDGTDAIIPIATTDVSGLLSPGLFNEHTTNNAKETNVSTNLSATTAAAQITINSSDGNNVVIAEATNSIAGLMSTTHHDKLDSLISGIITMDGVTSVAANVPGITTNSIVTVSFKSGKNGRQIVSVVPSTDTITITLSNTSSSNAKVMYIAIK